MDWQKPRRKKIEHKETETTAIMFHLSKGNENGRENITKAHGKKIDQMIPNPCPQPTS